MVKPSALTVKTNKESKEKSELEIASETEIKVVAKVETWKKQQLIKHQKH